MYGEIVKNIFFYPVPEAEALQGGSKGVASKGLTVNPEVLRKFARQLKREMKDLKKVDIFAEAETVDCDHGEDSKS